MSAGDVQPPWSSPTGASTPPPGRRRRRHPAARSRVATAVLSVAAFVAGTVGLWITQTVADADTQPPATTPPTPTAPSSRSTSTAATTSPSTTPTTAQLAPPSRRPADTTSHGS